MKKFVSFLLALMMIFGSSTLAFATDKTDTQVNSTSDESDGGSMPTDFAIILLLIAGGTAVASFKRHRNDRDDYDEPDDDTEEEIWFYIIKQLKYFTSKCYTKFLKYSKWLNILFLQYTSQFK